MVVGAKVCELTDDFLWFVCGLYVRILTPPLTMMCTLYVWSEQVITMLTQLHGTHGTWKTGKMAKKNPYQGKHREFGNFVKTQGILSTHREKNREFG